MTYTIDFPPHAELDLSVLSVQWPADLCDMPSPAWLLDMLDVTHVAPFERSEQVTATIRALLRTKLYKPRGMYKPASEYLVKAVESGRLGPDSSINVAVDLCNALSLHSGLPVSVVDADKLVGHALQIQEMPAQSSYVFNPSGQSFKLDGLICLCDADGACANPVKDAQRTKTSAGTSQTLYVIWGAESLVDRTAQVTTWLQTLCERLGATTTLIH